MRVYTQIQFKRARKNMRIYMTHTYTHTFIHTHTGLSIFLSHFTCIFIETLYRVSFYVYLDILVIQGNSIHRVARVPGNPGYLYILRDN